MEPTEEIGKQKEYPRFVSLLTKNTVALILADLYDGLYNPNE